MKMSPKIAIRTGVLIIMIALAAFSRMIPHLPNFSPIGAIGLFGAAYFTHKWQAFLIPLAAIWLSDLFLNNLVYPQYYPGFTWFYPGFYWLYTTYIVITAFGILLLKKVTLPRVIAGALGSSLLFFLVTNFFHWLFLRPGNTVFFPGSPVYSLDLNGLLACYTAALPFLKGTFFGDVFYVTALFGTFAALKTKYAALNVPEREYSRTVCQG
jgi:hypothetical protein